MAEEAQGLKMVSMKCSMCGSSIVAVRHTDSPGTCRVEFQHSGPAASVCSDDRKVGVGQHSPYWLGER